MRNFIAVTASSHPCISSRNSTVLPGTIGAFANAVRSRNNSDELVADSTAVRPCEFSKVSIFSDLNNLTDLTMSPFATTLLGYTHEEVRANFPGRLAALAQVLGTDVEGAFAQLVEMYDGYCFDGRMVRVFNPVSLGNALRDLQLDAYWFETGTPGWLMSYAKRHPMDVDDLQVGVVDLGTFEPADPSMPAVLLQTGYSLLERCEARVWARCIGSTFSTERSQTASTVGWPIRTSSRAQTCPKPADGQPRVSMRLTRATQPASPPPGRHSLRFVIMATPIPTGSRAMRCSFLVLPSTVLRTTWVLGERDTVALAAYPRSITHACLFVSLL